MTKKKFLKYYNCQMEGKYNMIMQMSEVLVETGLNYHDYIDIIKNYNKYYNKYINTHFINN
jgi:hypothetical protein